MGLDLALGCLVLLNAVRGWLRGFLLQATQLGGLVACVYVADPLRDLVKPEVAKYLPSIAPGLMDRLLWWSSAVVAYIVMVGVASLVIKMHRRQPFGETEPDRTDQFGGFLLGTAKGLLVAAFLAAGLEKYALGTIQGVDWAEKQAKTSTVLKWNADYRPVARIWAMPPVQHYVAHVRRMGLERPVPAIRRSEGPSPRPRPRPRPTRSGPPAAPPPDGAAGRLRTSPTSRAPAASLTGSSRRSRTSFAPSKPRSRVDRNVEPRHTPSRSTRGRPGSGGGSRLMADGTDRRPLAVPRWAVVLVLLGAYLSLRGYHSRDGDQAYRLPLAAAQARPGALCRRPVRAGVRRLQPAPRRADVARRGQPSAGPVGRPGGPLRVDLRGDLPRPRPPRPRRLARGGHGGRPGRGRAGADGQGRQHRDQPPLRGDAARPPDRLRAGLAGAWRSRSRGPRAASSWRPWRSGWRPWSTPPSACNWGCSWVPPGSPGASGPARRRSAGVGSGWAWRCSAWRWRPAWR